MIQQTHRPEWTVSCMKANDGYVAFGSRKIIEMEVNAEIEDGIEATFLGGLAVSKGPGYLKWITLKARFENYTMVYADTELGAMVGLLEAFRQEKLKEEAQFVQYRTAVEELKNAAASADGVEEYDEEEYYGADYGCECC